MNQSQSSCISVSLYTTTKELKNLKQGASINKEVWIQIIHYFLAAIVLTFKLISEIFLIVICCIWFFIKMIIDKLIK